MLRKCLEEARAAAGEAQVGIAQRVKEAQTVLETLQADKESLTATEEAAHVVLSEKVAALETAQAEVKSEERLCEEAEAGKASVMAERQTLEAAKGEADSIQNGSLQMLLDGGWADEELRDACIDAVCSYLKSEGADGVLLAALPKAFGCRPAECGAFDKIAVDEAVRAISDKVAACATQLAEGDERLEDVKAQYLGAWAISDLAREQVQAASEVRDNADSALQRATVDTKLAQSKVTDQDLILSTCLSESTIFDAKLKQLDVALSALAQLEAGEEAEQENKENVMAVDFEGKDTTMAMDHVQLPIQAGITA